MIGWDKVDPHLKLERIRVRNFRNIGDLDVTIPEDKHIICLVGPNGGGKSAILSLVINGLCRLTHETGPDLGNEPDSEDSGRFRRSWTTGEIGPEGPAYAFLMDWKSKADHPWYQLFVFNPESEDHDFISGLRRQFGIPPSGRWIMETWKNRPLADTDPLARSVFLFRPSNRFEIPYYEKGKHLKPKAMIPANWHGRRLCPVRCQSGLPELENLIIDMVLDRKMGIEHGRMAIDKLLSTLRTFRESDEDFTIKYWPVRKVGFGPINTLSLLSSGEADMLVTVGNIISQQVYLLQKFGKDQRVMPSGWVFIDEADAHLHPQWQQKVLPLLSELFPMTHFMVTTHSPFVLRSLPKGKSMVIRVPDGKIFDGDFSSWTIDRISDIMGIKF